MRMYAGTVRVLSRRHYLHVCACMLLLCACYVDSTLHLYAHATTITRKMQRQTTRHIVNHRHVTF